ncbi:putative esterase [Rubricella aquisinus]|uniref:Putative esterase n=1 Tax=Rubricella aquisinus TaxID=2028108 RepID=A0A840X0F1_9RHOB|nr:dienelactone hydrolase family protein [Rubricella aquisinus]MBB5516204.1 putative esterase [Rubricella aquisinus]
MRAFLEVLKGFLLGTVLCALFIAALIVFLPTAGNEARDRLAIQLAQPDEVIVAQEAERLRMPLPRPLSMYSTQYEAEDQGQTTYESDGRLVHILDFGTGGQPRPMVMLFHGQGRNGLSMLDMWKATGEREGLLLVAPDGIGGGWTAMVEDNQRIEALIEDVAVEYPVDRERIFLFGHSAGARHVLEMANHFEGSWRAAAVHGGVLPLNRVRPAAEPTPLRIYIGTEDTIFPYEEVETVADALARAGHPTGLVTITGHNHWYYTIGPSISRRAWDYFAEQ